MRAYVRATSPVRACVRACACLTAAAITGRYVYARARTRESAYVISDPGGDPGIRSHHTGLSTPTTVHHRQREAPLCTPNDTRSPHPARDIVACVVVRFEVYCDNPIRASIWPT